MSLDPNNTQPMPLVSVVLAAYNADRFISQTLESVLSQTYGNLEVIVVDDGSTDRTREIADQYARSDSRVRAFSQSNRGPCEARNFGIGHARGEYIASIDADDIWHPEKLQQQVEVFSENPSNIGLVYTWSAYMDENGSFTGGGCTSVEEGDVYVKLLCVNFIGNGSAALIRRSCIEQCGSYRDRFASSEDKELFVRIAECYDFKVVPRYLVGYRQVKGSLSRQIERLERSHLLLMQEIKDRHPEIPSKIYHWSLGILYSYLTARCVDNRNFRTAAHCFAKALRHDFSCISRLPGYIGPKLVSRRSSWLGRLRSVSNLPSVQRLSSELTPPDTRVPASSVDLLGACRANPSSSPFGIFSKRRIDFIERIHIDRGRYC